MSTDAAPAATGAKPSPAPSTGTTPAPAPAESWFHAELLAVEGRLADLRTALSPEIHDAETAAAVAWKRAAAGFSDLVSRNSAELEGNIAKAVAAYVLTLAPGAAPESAALALIAFNASASFFAFVETKLAAQAATPLQPIGPPLKASEAAAAPEPAKAS